ncbi:hypothetical protein APA_4104 [Pseudanabaena sp. lw0831]|jgi:hypothetical protein|uniref:hypothetical protein n=1 Tax=Pseudanabaena sp. lw0831 TaxID=1357935 RepID=UPI00191635F5|nr:hypothetical protein [Pseudanabaena sp. lw0831]GBO52000.1 hypothetical protein APA_4104 [Pseudanabaena sp. lw0831]
MDNRTLRVAIGIGSVTFLSLFGFAWWNANQLSIAQDRIKILATCIKRLDQGLSSGSPFDIPGVYLDWKGEKCEEAKEIAKQ